jgi:hypothetical protein
MAPLWRFGEGQVVAETSDQRGLKRRIDFRPDLKITEVA